MLKPRMIACVTVKDGLAVQSVGFRRFLPIGDPSVLVEFLSQWGIDEIAVADISAAREARGFDMRLIERCARRCFVPLMAAGGIRSVADVRAAIQAGADKICVNTAALENPGLISEIAGYSGSQSIVLAIDTVRDAAGGLRVASAGARRIHAITPTIWAAEAARLGAGEILLRSVERDGSKRGYDLDLAAAVAAATPIPLIVASGAGHPCHIAEVLEKPFIRAVAVGNMLSFTEHSPILIKGWLSRHGHNLRHGTSADYRARHFDMSGRPQRHSDGVLDELVFEAPIRAEI